jgi:hypothetical protein
VFFSNLILRGGNTNARAETIRYLLKAAFLAINVVNNFALGTAIQTALESVPIHRLQATWAIVELKSAGQRAQLNSILGIGGMNTSTLALKCCRPLVPLFSKMFLGTIEKGNTNKSIVGANGNHLNVVKFRCFANLATRFESMKRGIYHVPVMDTIHNVFSLQTVEWNDMNQLYDRSIVLEPKT